MIADEKKILLRQLKEGSHQAFQRLYESYFDLFYGFIFSSHLVSWTYNGGCTNCIFKSLE